METRTADNRLLKKAVIQAMPAGALVMIGISFYYMLDSLLAGALFTPIHIAAIGIVLPYCGLITAMTGIAGSGAVALMLSCIGRGDQAGRGRAAGFQNR